MKLLRRIRNIVNSNLNAMVAKAENPEKLLEQCISDMQDQSGKARAQVAHAIAAEKIVARLVMAADDNAQRLEEASAASAKAIGGRSGEARSQDVGSGDSKAGRSGEARSQDVGLGDSKAGRSGAARSQDVGPGDYKNNVQQTRDFVREHIAARRNAEELQRQWNQQLDSVRLLKNALGELQAKIDEARRRKDVLIARKRAAQAKHEVHASLAGIAETHTFLDARAFEAFDRVAEQVDTTEAEADAAAEVCVATLGPAGGAGSALNVTEAEIDAALADLQGHAAPDPRD